MRTARGLVLLIALLSVSGVAAAQTVDIQPGTLAKLTNADVYLDLFQQERTYFAVYPTAVQLDQQNFTVDAPSQVFLTLEKLQPTVPEGASAINFTGNASGSPTVTFTATGLEAGTRYQVEQDGSGIATVEADGSGTVSFNVTQWTGDHRFAVIKLQPRRLYLDTDQMSLELGEEQATSIGIYNPADTAETVELSVSSDMDAGSIDPTIRVDGDRAETVSFEIGPESQRRVELVVAAANCPDSCAGSVTVQMRSLATGQQYFTSMQVSVTRNTDVHGSPGITLVQVVVLALLGAALAAHRV